MWGRLLSFNSKQLVIARSFGRSSVMGGPDVKGSVAAKAPTKFVCEEGKTYAWCACGLSAKQPLCDGSHKNSPLGLTPMKWTSTATKEYFLCNCKQTENRPFCDGSHKKL